MTELAHLTKPSGGYGDTVGRRWSACRTISVDARYGDTPRGGNPRISEYEVHDRLADRKFYRYTLRDARALVAGILAARPGLKWDASKLNGDFAEFVIRSRDGLFVMTGFVGQRRGDEPGGMYSVGYAVTWNGKVLRNSQWWTGIENPAHRTLYLTAHAMRTAAELAEQFGVELR